MDYAAVVTRLMERHIIFFLQDHHTKLGMMVCQHQRSAEPGTRAGQLQHHL